MDKHPIRHVKILKDDIEKGCRGDGSVCPVADKLPFRVERLVYPGHTQVIYTHSVVNYLHSQQLRHWICTFDNKESVPAIELAIDRANHRISIAAYLSEERYSAVT